MRIVFVILMKLYYSRFLKDKCIIHFETELSTENVLMKTEKIEWTFRLVDIFTQNTVQSKSSVFQKKIWDGTNGGLRK
jgi:hypothetical protein